MKNKRSKNDEIPRGIWKVIKAKVRKIGIAKAKAKENKERKRETEEKKIKEGKTIKIKK